MINIIGVGDIMPGGILTGVDKGFVDEKVLQILSSADIRVGTLETAIGNDPNWYEGKMNRLGDVIYTKDIDINKIKTLKIDIVSLANNHVFDLGPEGIRHTIEALDAIGVKHCGAGMNLKEASRPVVVELEGKSIAFVAFCDWRPETTGWCLMATESSAGVNPLYDEHVKEQLKLLKSKYDYVFAIPHWGKEHTCWPTKNVYYLAHKMIEWGADVVLGGHTHRIQPVMNFGNKCIAYSLGNFLFSDRIIFHPRSTWYPKENEVIDLTNLPKTFGYPYVDTPTLKCSPEKNRIGIVNSITIDADYLTSSVTYTYMDEKCHLSVYDGKDPVRIVKFCLKTRLYPLFVTGKKLFVKSMIQFERALKSIIRLRFIKNCVFFLISKLQNNKLASALYTQFIPFFKKENSFCNIEKELKTLFKNKGQDFSHSDIKCVYKDYLKCHFKYGILLKDYMAYEWYNRSELSRDNYITDRINSKLFVKFDDRSLCPIMADKVRFNQVYHDFIKRDWMWISSISQYEQFENFCRKHERIVIKPKDGQRGDSVALALVKSTDEIKQVWEKCLANKYLIEEVLTQGELAKMHPQSVNTIRISTAIDDKGNPYIMASSIRCGRGDNFVDNAHSGGLFCGIDVTTGMIISPGIDKTGMRFLNHPDTKVKFLGMMIPQWEELKQIAKKAAMLIPGLRYIGWDWVLCSDGHWELLEGNEPGNPDVLQLGIGHGLLNEYLKILK